MIKIACSLCQQKDFKELFFKDEMSVVQCKNCGLIFTNPQLTRYELTAHYNKSYYYCPKKDQNDKGRYFDYNARYLKGKEKQRFKSIFEKLDYYQPNKGLLLDVGAATGFFVHEANKNGWQAEGVEISKWAVDWGKKNLKVKIFNGDLKTAKYPQKAFSVVTMLDCLEHVQNPLKELKEINRVLKKRGIVYIETINFDHFITRFLVGQKYVHMVPKFHLYYFGRKQIKKLMEKAGFELLEEELTSSSVGDYEYQGASMYFQYLKLLLKPKKAENYAFKDVIKIFAQKIY